MITVRSPPGSYGAVRRAWSVPAPARRQLPTGAVTARAGTCRPLPRSGGAHRGEELPWVHTVPDIVLTRTTRRSWRPIYWPAWPTRCGRRPPARGTRRAARPGPLLHGPFPARTPAAEDGAPAQPGSTPLSDGQPHPAQPDGTSRGTRSPAPPPRRRAAAAAGPGRRPAAGRRQPGTRRPAPTAGGGLGAPDRRRGGPGDRVHATEAADHRTLGLRPGRRATPGHGPSAGHVPAPRFPSRPRGAVSPRGRPGGPDGPARGPAASGSPPWAASRSTPPCPRR